MKSLKQLMDSCTKNQIAKNIASWPIPSYLPFLLSSDNHLQVSAFGYFFILNHVCIILFYIFVFSISHIIYWLQIIWNEYLYVCIYSSFKTHTFLLTFPYGSITVVFTFAWLKIFISNPWYIGIAFPLQELLTA